MVQDSGGVPLAAKGVVIGLNTKSMDVVWDVAFMSGTTLNSRFDNPTALRGDELMLVLFLVIGARSTVDRRWTSSRA